MCPLHVGTEGGLMRHQSVRRRWLAGLLVTLAVTASACGAKRPVVYPNERARQAGDGGVQADIDECLSRAKQYGASSSTTQKAAGSVAGETVVGAGTGAAVGAVGGAIYGTPAAGLPPGLLPAPPLDYCTACSVPFAAVASQTRCTRTSSTAACGKRATSQSAGSRYGTAAPSPWGREVEKELAVAFRSRYGRQVHAVTRKTERAAAVAHRRHRRLVQRGVAYHPALADLPLSNFELRLH